MAQPAKATAYGDSRGSQSHDKAARLCIRDPHYRQGWGIQLSKSKSEQSHAAEFRMAAAAGALLPPAGLRMHGAGRCYPG